MSKNTSLPRLELPHALGLTFEVPGSALARWNGALAAKEEKKGDEEDTSISVYDPIGFDPWSGGGVTAKRIAAALRTIGKKDVVVNINSPGGDLFEGIAIYNLLRDHPGKVTTRVVGLAASAASVIAMAGDEIEVARAGFMMIHNVWVVAIGNRNDLRDAADQLETFDEALASIYAARTGMEKGKVAKLMDKETWFGGEEAIEQGFADALLAADAIEEKDTEEAKNALRGVDAVLAKYGVPRSARRALISRIKDDATLDAGAVPAGGVAPRADATATHDAGAQQAVDQAAERISKLGKM